MTEKVEERQEEEGLTEYDDLLVYHFDAGDDFYVTAPDIASAAEAFQEYAGPHEMVGVDFELRIVVCDPASKHEQ